VLTQILTEMDGIEELKGVFVLAATNRRDRLDAAILRPGRLDELVEIGLPDAVGRLEILRIQLRNKPLASDVDLESLLPATEGWSGAQLMGLAERAAMHGLRRAWTGAPLALRQEDLRQALAELVRGAEQSLGSQVDSQGKGL
jgi:SpoVK/Ycf46/Vps4 family AAA+-type ATPase